jgi:ABC-type glycerol-3-phosphate transport system permease component
VGHDRPFQVDDRTSVWPLIVANAVATRPVTVGLQIFTSTDQGIDCSVISAATPVTLTPLLFGFLLFSAAIRAEFPAGRHSLGRPRL